MSGYGYSYVTDKAFVAFAHNLGQGAWRNVSIAGYEGEGKMLDAAALDAPHPVLWKLRISLVITALKVALGSGKLDVLDAGWDSSERRLHFRLAERADDTDAEVRAAAERLRRKLLKGKGTEQTVHDFDAEVDFGRQQLELAKEAAIAADIKKLKVDDLLHDIERATEALAVGLGRQGGARRTGLASVQQRDALAACTSAFNGVHDHIAWFLANTPNGPARDLLTELEAPFAALLARNPPSQAKAGNTPPPAAPPPSRLIA
jgi:hypothetical protein